MRCPFLKEALVRFCEVAPCRKMIPRTTGPANRELCTSPDFVRCPWAAGHAETRPGGPSCPFLRETLVLSCGAEANSRLVPYSESIPSCCQTGSYHYCDVYLSMAEPDRAREATRGADARGVRGEIETPEHLWFSTNHMWLDAREDESVQIGIDAFLPRVIGVVEEVRFLTDRGTRRPAAVVRTHGADLYLVFPNRVEITASNVLLKVEPQRIVSDPYGRGWLFAGREPAPRLAGAPRGTCAGLLRGADASEWMRAEVDRLSRHVHGLLGPGCSSHRQVLCDGGTFAPGLAQHLDRDSRLRLFDDFFRLPVEEEVRR